MTQNSYCAWLYQLTSIEESRWGKEAIALAETARTGVPVLPGFAIAREVFFLYFNESSTRHVITKAVQTAPLEKAHLLPGVAKEIRQHILKTPLPVELKSSLAAYLEEFEDQLLMTKGTGLELVLTAQNNQHLRIQGKVKTIAEAELLLRKLYALYFEDTLLHTRLESEDLIVPSAFAVLVQSAQPTQLSGTAVRIDAEKHDETVVTITVHHHDHGAHEQRTEEDVYRFDVPTGILLSKSEVHHQWAATSKGHTTPARKTTSHHAEESQLSRLAKMTKRAQTAFSDLQFFTWVFTGTQLFITGVQPFEAEITATSNGIDPLLWGIVGHLGVASGPVRHIASTKALESIQLGDVVVTEHISEKMLDLLAGAAALICESGHGASLDADSARRLGIPAVLGVAHARTALQEGHVVTVDGSHGAVYSGIRRAAEVPVFTPPAPTTGTKVYATVREVLDLPTDLSTADGIGVLRSEQILELLGIHPQDVLRKGVSDEYVSILADGIARVARAVYPRPVVYQLHDLANVFLGRSTRVEPNPLIGYRGAHRLLAEPETLDLELQALDQVAKSGLLNIQLLIPMVRSVSELDKVLKYLDTAADQYTLPELVWVRCETPALAIQADELAASGVYGVLFDIPALSTLIVGIDGGNHQIGHHLDTADGAVLQALEYAIMTCRAEGVVTSIVAEGEMLAAEVVETAVRAGVTAVSTETMYLQSTRGLLASIEQRMLVEHVLDSKPELEA